MGYERDYKSKYNRLIREYTSFESTMNEDGEDPAAAPADPAMDPAAAPVDPAMDPAAGGAPADPAMDPAAGGQEAGITPADPAAAPADPSAAPEEGGENNDEEDKDKEDDDDDEKNEEIIDSQEKAEKKIDKLSDKFERLLDKISSFERQIDDNNRHIKEFESELLKRNPTPEEKMTMRSVKSGPFDQRPEYYWNSKAPSNYSPEDDRNGEDMPEYKITKGDIDNIKDWSNISKSFDDERMGLKDILGY